MLDKNSPVVNSHQASYCATLLRHVPTRTVLVCSILGLSVGCGEESYDGELLDGDSEVAELDEQDADEKSELLGDLVIRVDDVSRPDLLIAAVELPDQTHVYFAADSNDETSVDVITVGRSGVLDYASLVGPGKATPLELYVALAGQDAYLPDRLLNNHAEEVVRAGRGIEEGFRPPVLPTSASHVPSGTIDENFDESTYTCLSWSNFSNHVDNVHEGFANRTEITKAPLLTSSVDPSAVWSPGSGTWDFGYTYLVGCNYNSSGTNGNDEVRSEIGYDTGCPTNCFDQDYLITLEDGWYHSISFGYTTQNRLYHSYLWNWSAVTPPALDPGGTYPSLTGWHGAVHTNGA